MQKRIINSYKTKLSYIRVKNRQIKQGFKKYEKGEIVSVLYISSFSYLLYLTC